MYMYIYTYIYVYIHIHLCIYVGIGWATNHFPSITRWICQGIQTSPNIQILTCIPALSRWCPLVVILLGSCGYHVVTLLPSSKTTLNFDIPSQLSSWNLCSQVTSVAEKLCMTSQSDQNFGSVAPGWQVHAGIRAWHFDDLRPQGTCQGGREALGQIAIELDYLNGWSYDSWYMSWLMMVSWCLNGD